jgi:hypothetical protein
MNYSPRPISFQVKPWAVKTTYSNLPPAINRFFNRHDAETFASFMNANVPNSHSLVYWDDN